MCAAVRAAQRGIGRSAKFICRPASPFPTGPTLTVKRRCANVAGLNRSSLLAKKQPTLPFEAALKELEALVEKMEHGELSLEESLRYFERSVALTRHCQQALQEAEQKVEILLEKGEQTEKQPFADDTRLPRRARPPHAVLVRA